MTNQQGAPEAPKSTAADGKTELFNVPGYPLMVRAVDFNRLNAENERLTALVEAQQLATHVQNPAGIEHVVGDVSKNGAESNMAQQPAPSAAVALSDDLRDGLVAISEAIADQDDRAAQAMLREILAAPQPSPTPQAAFQQRVQPWLLECFGAEIAADRVERNHRFLEESLELVQSLGCTASEAHQLVDYVFGRPVGDPPQEVGGVMVTLAALCLASGLDMHDAGEVELTRISAPEVVAKIRAKQAAKPKHSPLPQSLTPPADSQPTHQRDTSYPPLPECDATTVGLGAVWNRHSMRAYVDADRTARTPADSQPAPEYVGNGMFKGETIEKAAEHWANWCDVRCMTGLSEFLRVVAARAPADSQPAPAGFVPVAAFDRLHAHAESLAERLLASEQAAPTPPAQTADSVLEDAMRYRWLRQHWFTMLSSYQRGITFKLGGPRWSDITEAELDAAIDATRKQGANHD